MKSKNKKTYGAVAEQRTITYQSKFLLFLCLILSSTLLAGVQAAAVPPAGDENPRCIMYAYASSGQHHFLALNESIIYGDSLTVVHNCDYVKVSGDEGFMANSSKSTFSLPLSYGIHNLTFENNAYTQTLVNLTFIPTHFSWYEDYMLLTNQRIAGDWVLVKEVTARENFAVFVSGILSLVLIFAFYWRVIEHYLDHNRIEERRG
jgi:hypothetical protein